MFLSCCMTKNLVNGRDFCIIEKYKTHEEKAILNVILPEDFQGTF